MSTNASGRSLVALTTDFGLDDPYVGVMKAVILARAPHVTIVDVTHGVPAQDVEVGAFFLARAVPYFPPATVHVAVVDPGVGSSRRLLAAEAHGQSFLAPDNGLLSGVLDRGSLVFELDVERCALPERSHTFHGRDILAPAAAAIANGIALSELCSGRVHDWVKLTPEPLTCSSDGRSIAARVLFVDRYGNVVLNASSTDLGDEPERWMAVFPAESVAFAHTYAQVPSGGALLLVDSFDALEIAVNGGDASIRFRLARGARVTLEKRT
ncbi:MAG: SAM-dependent chlorinase/fluorinase [Planctomycetota bacterium]|nr:SAM-dependent chlorinase/fluorinase [Planctomycetota bacterium]